MHKLIAFPYTNNIHTEKEIIETLPFIITSKKLKYLGVNLTKEIEDFYNENFKFLKRDLDKDAEKWKEIQCSGLVELTLWKRSFYQKYLHIQCNSNKNFHNILQRTEKAIHKKAVIVQAILSKNVKFYLLEMTGSLIYINDMAE